MAVIDFHTHILPGVDDGSRSTEESLEMYRMSQAQGTDVLIATPHFYAGRDRVGDFLERRQKAYGQICRADKSLQAHLKLGAEVAFFPGISQAEKLTQLTVEDTDLLLLEMPFEPWSDRTLAEVRSIIEDRGLRVMAAHLERYLKIPGNKSGAAHLMELPVIVQINAGSLSDWRLKRKLIKMFRNGQAHILGSDCHGCRHRMPNLGEGRQILEKTLGSDFLRQMDDAGEKLLYRS